VELVLSRRPADQLRIGYSPISREVSLSDGTRMTAARTNQIALDIAGSHKNLTAVVVDMVAFHCILGLPWLDAASTVVNWKARKLLLPTKNGPKEVDLSHNPCRSDVSYVSLLSTAQLLKIGKEGSPSFLATLRPTSEVATTIDEEELSPAWKDLVGKFEDVFPDDHPGLPPRRAVQLEIKLEPGTTPASKATYRLSPAEMDELKAQLAVFREKKAGATKHQPLRCACPLCAKGGCGTSHVP
jgi:hypothetical protein